MRTALCLAPAVLAAVLAVAGCGQDGDAAPSATGSSGTSGPGGGPCVSTDAAPCFAAGLPHCADVFKDPDGVCRPSAARCPAGTIPRVSEGCVPVGIQGCAPQFIDPDGLCRPVMDRCPAGTIPRSDEGCTPVGITACAPELVGEDGQCHPSMALCPEGTYAVPQEGCVPVDGPGCGSGTFGDIVDAADVVYVDPAYAGGNADGSKGKPLPSIASALTLVPTGGRIALAAGTYAEPLIVSRSVTIEGRCPSLVRITGTSTLAGAKAVVAIDGVADVTLRGLDLGGAGIGVFAIDAPGLVLSRVRVSGATGHGVLIKGAAATAVLDHVLIEGTLAEADGDFGRGLVVESGAAAELSHSALYQNRDVGFAVFKGTSSLVAKDVLVEATAGRDSDQISGFGGSVQLASSLTLTDSALVANHEQGLLVTNPDSSALVAHSLVEGTLPATADGYFGHGVHAQDGATLTVDHSVVMGSHQLGVAALNHSTTLLLTDSLITDTRGSGTSDSLGQGVDVEDGAVVTIAGSALVANRRAGLYAVGDDTVITAERLLAQGTLPEPSSGRYGDGVEIASGARLSLTSCALVDNLDAGVYAQSAGTALEVTGSLVEGTREQVLDGENGRGVDVSFGATAVVTSTVVRDDTTTGMLAYAAGTLLETHGNLVQATRAKGLTGTFGRGIVAQEGATATLDGDLVIGNRTSGLAAAGAGTHLSATSVVVEGTLPEAADQRFGDGVEINGATFVGSGCAFVGNRYLGVVGLMPGADVTLSDSLVRGTLADDAQGELGVGLAAFAGAVLSASRVRVEDSHVAGVMVVGASAAVSDAWVDGVPSGLFVDPATLQAITGVGDGVLVAHGGDVKLTQVWCRGAARAGVLFDASQGALDGVVARGNRFGLVLQGSPTPTWDPGGTDFDGNAEQAVVTGTTLPVPDAVSPVPGAP